MTIRGKAWVFGDNVDTDMINPGAFMTAPMEEAAAHAFEAIAPEFATNVKMGDLIVAGTNFGCGSSRETAPQVLKHLGVGCILAEDFARIFFRNAIAIGLPVMVVAGIAKRVKAMEELRVNLDEGEVLLENGDCLKATPLHPKMKAFVDAGGIDKLLQDFKVAAKKK